MQVSQDELIDGSQGSYRHAYGVLSCREHGPAIVSAVGGGPDGEAAVGSRMPIVPRRNRSRDELQ
jgi:hypothetical protein